MKKSVFAILVVGVLLVISVATFAFFNLRAGPVSPELARVVNVIDGDTIKLEGGERVRLIGVDTPETKDPRRGVQCFGKEASARTKSLLEGRRVRLEPDQENKDRHGRSLRYVWTEDGALVNLKLVEEGYAKAYPFRPNVKYKERFRKAEEKARAEKKGLWGACPQNQRKKSRIN